ncbi:hypothetical protein HPB50_016560 [Hyalomma asiaticum]|uniref:Uncharacterized protein n=1 Tax=Hyalomma asiaticum TaxID=266040 RepID=A0ACB7SAE7_HYAAI|nr:hypothetical protein HPB50_016560 [Hyalomma asiaticum]
MGASEEREIATMEGPDISKNFRWLLTMFWLEPLEKATGTSVCRGELGRTTRQALVWGMLRRSKRLTPAPHLHQKKMS